MRRKRIWIVSEVFYPDTDIATANIATEIALKFREGFEVHVICGPQDYERKNQSATIPELEGIHIHRWKYFNYDKNHKIKRLIRVIGISLGLFIKGLLINKKDKAFVISNPAFITPLYAFLKWIKRFEYILLMHDVFPENLVVGGYIKETSVLYRLTRALFVRSRLAANKIIVIGRDMKELLLRYYPDNRKDDIVVIPNWADTQVVFPLKEEQNKLLEKYQLDNKIVILFAGNHGVLQNLLSFIKIIQQTNNLSVHYIFAGGGATKKDLELFVQQNDIGDVTFLPSYSRAEMNNILNACHIGLVSLSDDVYGVGVPSKSYNILSAGKPILFLGNTKTEIARFVIENDLGWAFEYRNTYAIVDFLNNLSLDYLSDIIAKGAKGREVVKNHYKKEEVLERVVNLVS